MNTRTLLAIVFAAFPYTRAFSQAPAAPPLISVSGSAEVKVAPDEIHLRVGVETRQQDLEQAKRENDDRVSKALGFDTQVTVGISLRLWARPR